jgi:hypothetical protein
MAHDFDLPKYVPQTFSIADLLEWYRADTLNLSPRFQRRSVWKPLAKSYLIDTILRGLPVPAIVLRELPPNKELKRLREVVDGQQRLRTVFAFILPSDPVVGKDKFKLSKVHHSDLAGYGFDELPDDQRTRILEYNFHVSVLPSMTTDRQVLDIFARMNATGSKLNEQEVRNAEYYGYFKTLSYKLASLYLDLWIELGLFTATDFSRMRDAQFVSDLLGVLLDGPAGLNQKNLDRLYKEHDGNASFAKSGSARFQQIVDFLHANFPWDDCPRFKRTSIFYALFAVVHEKMPDSARNWQTSSTWQIILSNAARIQQGKIPQSVRDSIESQPTNRKERAVIIAFLSKGA